MEKTIETKFFEAFEFGGLVHWCINFVKHKYDLGFKYDKNDKPRVLSERDKQFYFDEIPKITKSRFDEFDRSVIETLHSPLIDEIEQNLQGCQNAVERDSYIFSLITPFAELSGLILPIAEIDRLKKGISDIEKEIEYWNKLNQDEQLEACREKIDRLNWQVERKKEVSNKLIELLCRGVFEKGTVEYCLCAMLGTMGTYSDRLFAMLIQHGIDLRTYQKKAGIYLRQYWLITDIDFYVGSMELAQHYLDNLPASTINDEPTQTFTMPTELDTSEAQKYFDRAIQEGLMSEDYKWLSGLEMLACFASDMSKKLNLGKGENSDGTKRISWKPFETLFKLKSGTLKSNLKDIKRTGDNPKDVDMIDQIFKD